MFRPYLLSLNAIVQVSYVAVRLLVWISHLVGYLISNLAIAHPISYGVEYFVVGVVQVREPSDCL
jgi:hypothetical protein